VVSVQSIKQRNFFISMTVFNESDNHRQPIMTTTTLVQSPLTGDDLMLFGLHHHQTYAEQVAQQLGMVLSPHEERQFEDGECKIRPLVNVRGRDVFVLQSLHADGQQSGNDKLCRLLFFIGALKDAAAARVTAIVPYLAYSRKDQKSKPRDPVITRYVAALFEAVGTDAVVTMDVHNLAAYQNAFRCRTEHLQATPLFVAHFAHVLQGREVVVVSPDAGGIKRAEHFRRHLSSALGRPVGAAFAEKYRSGGVVSGDMLVGEVSGKAALIIDDLISTGTTLARTARVCIRQGAVRVMAAATHGLFVGNANTVLADAALEQIVVTDTITPCRLHDHAVQSKVTILGSTTLCAQAIYQLHVGGSVTALMHC
jgi:ribose-phosphate pyrophosphokinase